MKALMRINYGDIGKKQDKEKHEEYLNKYQNGLFNHNNSDNKK